MDPATASAVVVGKFVLAAMSGVVAEHLYTSVKKARTFESKRELLETTLEILGQKLDELEEKKVTVQVTKNLGQLLQEGMALQAKCSKISSWNHYKRKKYATRIDDFHSNLQLHISHLQISGGN